MAHACREGYPGPSFPRLPAGPQQRRYHRHTGTGETGVMLSGLPSALRTGIPVTPGRERQGDPVRTSGPTTHGHPPSHRDGRDGGDPVRTSGATTHGHPPSHRDGRDREILSGLPVPLRTGITVTTGRERRGRSCQDFRSHYARASPVTPGRERRGRSCQDIRYHYARASPVTPGRESRYASPPSCTDAGCQTRVSLW